MPEPTLPTLTAIWTVYCDGSALPNPGRMGLGAVITAPDGTQSKLSVATDARGCNNEAELRALMLALLRLQAQGARAVQIYSDNSILVAQLTGSPGQPFARLAPLFEEARAQLALFDQVQLNWIPRHRNGLADALAREALGLPPKPSPPARPRRP
jgi:ribonuclease HI